MTTEVSAVSFRQNLGELLNQVQYRNDSIVISTRTRMRHIREQVLFPGERI